MGEVGGKGRRQTHIVQARFMLLRDLVLPTQNPESVINVQMTLTSMVNTLYYNVTVTIDYTPTRQRQCLPSSFPDFFKYLILSCSALTLVEY